MSDDLLHRTAEAIRQQALLPSGSGRKLLVAVSGGVDSMVLLTLLQSLAVAPPNRWQLVVVHFNHQLRGRASDADERLVRRLARKFNLPCHVGRANVPAFARRTGVSIEMAARQLRHAFFARVGRRLRIRTLALAHHADDQVEQFFLRLLRGAGGLGLAGMSARNRSFADPKLTLIRPLLKFGKTEILAYARTAGVPFREDATNDENDYLRNRIRNQLLPLLAREYQPGVNATILRAMDAVGAESAFVDEVARAWRKAAGRAGSRSPLVRVGEPFATLPTAIQRKIIHQQLIEREVTPDFALVEALRLDQGKPITVSPGVSLCLDAAGKIKLRRFHPLKFNRNKRRIPLTGRLGRVAFSDQLFQWRLVKTRRLNRQLIRQAGQECFDADKVGGVITLRHWRAGDRFQPIGLPAAVKLQDLFVNAKIPLERRRQLVVATSRTGDIFWVESLRIGELFKLTPQTRRVLVWTWGGVQPGKV